MEPRKWNQENGTKKMEPRKWNQENGTKKMEAFGSRVHQATHKYFYLHKTIYKN